MASDLYAQLHAFAERLRGLTPKKRLLIAFGFGVVSALAFPPYNLTFLLWLCFPALLWLLQGAPSLWRAALTGGSFAFGFMVLGLYWIAASMFVDIRHFWWAVPLAVAGLPAFFAIDYAVMSAVAWKIGLRGVPGAVTLGLCWFLGDYARGHLFTGFPWILVGYSWTPVLPMLQLTSVGGIYGLTLLTIVTAFLPALLAEGRGYRWPVVVGAVILIGCGLWGEMRLQHATHAMVPDVRIRLVQPNIQQEHKWDNDKREADFQHLLRLTSAPVAHAGDPEVTHVVWPETASTFRLAEDPLHRDAIANVIPSASSVITGVIRRSLDAQNQIHYFNSLEVIDGRARLVGIYDKVHLVPYGEYFPFTQYLHMRALANLGVDFDHGDHPRSLRVQGLPAFSPLICYEAIFSGAVIDHDDRPDFILNITNDGWYGHTAGPYQHFAIVRIRAIEEGMPLLRAANTGISGSVDAYGHILTRLGISKDGFIDTDLPVSLPPTFFAKHGEWPLWIGFGLLCCGVVLARLRRR